MARMTIKGTEDFELQLSQLGSQSTEISKNVVMAGAKPLADRIRRNLSSNLASSKYSRGNLLDSLGIARPDVDRNGNVNTKIGFTGYDETGVPNAIKARAMESGTSKQKKKPFIRPAVISTKDMVIETMRNKLDEEINKIMK